VPCVQFPNWTDWNSQCRPVPKVSLQMLHCPTTETFGSQSEITSQNTTWPLNSTVTELSYCAHLLKLILFNTSTKLPDISPSIPSIWRSSPHSTHLQRSPCWRQSSDWQNFAALYVTFDELLRILWCTVLP